MAEPTDGSLAGVVLRRVISGRGAVIIGLLALGNALTLWVLVQWVFEDWMANGLAAPPHSSLEGKAKVVGLLVCGMLLLPYVALAMVDGLVHGVSGYALPWTWSAEPVIYLAANSLAWATAVYVSRSYYVERKRRREQRDVAWTQEPLIVNQGFWGSPRSGAGDQDGGASNAGG